MDDLNEKVENNTEQGRFFMEIEDTRTEKDPVQQFALAERLKTDKVDLALIQTKKFLGKYSTVDPQDLSITLIDGKLGEGQAKNKGGQQPVTIEVQLPNNQQVVTEVEQSLEPLLVQVDDKEAKTREIVEAVTVSTALHEGVHALLESRPDSQFAQDFETATGLTNEHGETSTLLDEGIAYAIQGIYAPDIKPIGSLAPVAKEKEDKIVVRRKNLGEKLRPIIKEYIDNGKSIDANFFEKAKVAIINVISGKLNPEIPMQKSEILSTGLENFGAKRVREGAFEFAEVQNPQSFLEWATVNGFVFHGSARRIEGELVPQQANDVIKESGNRNAVYMTNNPLLAEFTALAGGIDVGQRQNRCFMEIGSDKKVNYPQQPEFRVSKPENISEQGYVYVFDKDSQVSEDVGGEFLSYEPIKPLVVIKIRKDNFNYPIEKIEDNL